MDEDAGNEYQNQSIVIDVRVEAKQMPYEYDSISNQYDAKAEYPLDGIVYHVSITGNDNNPGTQILQLPETIILLRHVDSITVVPQVYSSMVVVIMKP